MNSSLRRLDRLQIAGLSVNDTRRITAGSPGASYLLVLGVAGGLDLDAEGATLSMRTGDLAVASGTGTVRLSPAGAEAAEALVLHIPRDAAGPYADAFAAAAGSVLGADTTHAGLAGHLLQGIGAQPESWSPPDPERLAQHVVGLFGLLCADGAENVEPSSRRGLLRAAKGYIEDHLTEADLTPQRVAAAQNVSTRTLHRLFKLEGLTIAGWIRERRLENCRVDLRDARLSEIPVAVIGSRWGLWDAAHFSRIFKSVYGVSPGAYRSGADGGAADAAEPIALLSA